jgi:LPS-assembly lipoprotein
MKSLRSILALSLLLPLAGCGFQLRNALVLPPDLGPVAVTARDPYSPLADSLARSLERAGATPASADAAATSTKLELLSEKWVDLPIAVDTLGRAQEYSLRYAVVFQLSQPGAATADGGTAEEHLLVPQQAVELSRDYIAPPSDSIGRNSERELLANEMRKDMNAAILRRIDAALRAAPAAGAAKAP